MAKRLSYEADIVGGATIRNKLVIPVLATDPVSPTEGTIWFNSTDNLFRYYDGTATVSLSAASGLDTEAVQDIVGAQLTDTATINFTYNDTTGLVTANIIDGSVTVAMLAFDPATQAELDAALTANSTGDRARANHTGTQTASTISDFTEAAQDAVGGSLTDSSTIDFTYDDVANTVTAIIKANSVTTAMLNFDVATQAELDAALTANSTADRARANHTGTQLSTTISDFTEAAQDAVGAILTDSATVDFTYNDAANTITATVLDSPTVSGQTATQIMNSTIAAIVDGSPGTLDTLNEIAAALGDDPNFATTIVNNINTRVKSFSANLTGGALTEVVTHNLNTRDLASVRVYVNSGSYEEEDYIIQATTLNTITVVSEGANIPTGRRIVVSAAGV